MAGMIKRGVLLHIVFAVVSALVAFVGGTFFGVAMGAAIYAAYVIMMFAEGCERGEHACGVRDTIARIEAQGKKADDKLAQGTYNVASAVKCALILSLPLVLLALVNIIFADSNTAGESVLGVICRIVFLPEAFITRICTESIKYNTETVQKVAAAVISSLDYGTINTETLIAGVSNAGIFGYAYDLAPLTIMRIAYIPASIIPAAAMLIGYLRGPKLREKTLSDMLKGTSKKRKKLKVFGKQRQAKQAKPEI